LLLTERGITNRIDIKSFYLRRILRIWPLYYLIVLLSFTLIPFLANTIPAFQQETHYFNKVLKLQESPYSILVLFLLFLPNFALALKPAVVGAAQSWSVGVEEQFYLIWPHLINRIGNKLILLIGFIMIGLLPQWADLIHFIHPAIGETLHFIIKIIPINVMAIGGIGAFFLYYHKESLQAFFKSATLFVINTLLFLILCSVDIDFPAKNLLFDIVIMLEILFVIQSHFKINIRHKQLERIGEISYGVYMYHPLMMYCCFSLWNTVIPIQNNIGYNISIYVSVILSTLAISRLSYSMFERKFIAIKNKKFTVVQSGKH